MNRALFARSRARTSLHFDPPNAQIRCTHLRAVSSTTTATHASDLPNQFLTSFCQQQGSWKCDLAVMAKGGYYAVQKGRNQGVFMTWAECEAATKGFAGAVFKKFPSKDQAERFVKGNGYGAVDSSASTSSSLPTYQEAQASTSTNIGKAGKKKRSSFHDQPSAAVRGNKASPSSTKLSGLPKHTVGHAPNVFGSNWMTNKCVVYCDGSSIGNGKASARAGWGVFFEDPSLHHLNESRRLPGTVQTNNRAELMAITRAIQLAPNDGRELIIFTDSQYSIKTVTEWLPGWKRRNWITSQGEPVANKDLIVQLDRELCGRVPRPKLEYVPGHRGVEGNEVVDRMAKYGASLPLADSVDLGRRSQAMESHLRHEELAGLREVDLALSAEEETHW